MRVLRTDVYVGGLCWPAGSVPPPGIADRITNQQAWTEVPDAESDTEAPTPADPPAPPVVIEPVPEQPNDDAGDDLVIGEVVADDGSPSDPLPPGAPSVQAPPRSGRGSGIEAWREFALLNDVDVRAGAERAEIIAACEDAGLLDEE
jgi:hypothetical protein